MTFPSLLVILGQPDYTDKKFVLQKKYTRRVKRVQVHPYYRGTPDGIKKPKRTHMPIFDFALLEVIKPMYGSHQNFDHFKFEPTMRPVCLPSISMWKAKFVNQLSSICGYGRVKAKKISGKHQTALRLMQADLRIIGPQDKKCEKVK